jgi:hypothetical protein
MSAHFREVKSNLVMERKGLLAVHGHIAGKCAEKVIDLGVTLVVLFGSR